MRLRSHRSHVIKTTDEKEKTMKTDFTYGNVFKQLVYFSGPIILANLLQISFQFVDSLWVGNLLGAKALGAAAVSGTVFFTVLSFVLGVNNAALTILAQQKEKGIKGTGIICKRVCRSDDGDERIARGYRLFFTEPLLSLLQTPGNMMDLAVSYLRIHFIGIIFLFGYNFISTVLRAVGDSQTPLRFVLLAVILNLFMDPLFISVFNLGIAGAAYATVVSQGIAFIYGVVYTVRKQLVPFSKPALPSLAETSVILKLGVPAGLQMMVISGGSMAIMSVVNSFGESVVSGFGAVQRLDSLLILPAMAIGTAVNSMAGQTFGSGDMERTKNRQLRRHLCPAVYGCRQHRDISDRLSRGQAVYIGSRFSRIRGRVFKTIAFSIRLSELTLC